ncbi:PTS sugar transporter subunit IIC, partial [Bacillus wiedmannii]|nr:PTS sugar transporter subunit IIC [Bacillus wiedmannii]
FVSGMIPLMMANLPFTKLAPIAAIISTDWTIMDCVLVLINFVISLVIYYPFFKMYEKQQLAGEEKTEFSEPLSS